ncbi:MAG: hypothetical protein E7112_00720 [Bacteroidales bacterium]|nr:hypothetical protein [Bacteroidales bacterium]
MKNIQDIMMQKATKRSRLEAFANSHNMTDRYPIKELSRWHMLMTKSCASGREAFAQRKGLDLENGTLTVPEFIELVKRDWGSEEIEKLEHLMKAREDGQPKKRVMPAFGFKKPSTLKPQEGVKQEGLKMMRQHMKTAVDRKLKETKEFQKSLADKNLRKKV